MTNNVLSAFQLMGATILPCDFVIGIQGLETSIETFFWEYEWQIADLPANMSWEHVKVRYPGDVQKWIEARNRYLSAAWTPNQDDEERAENAQIMRDAEKMMSALEIK